jgi:rRNA-processing protein FCF1
MTDAAAEGTSSGGQRPVVLDSNALMMQFQFHVDIESELNRILDFDYEIVVPDLVIDELTGIAKESSGKDQHEARMAIELAKDFQTREAPAEGDDGIVQLADELDAIVVTNDKILRARLRAKDIPNVHMRSKAFLSLEGGVSR